MPVIFRSIPQRIGSALGLATVSFWLAFASVEHDGAAGAVGTVLTLIAVVRCARLGVEIDQDRVVIRNIVRTVIVPMSEMAHFTTVDRRHERLLTETTAAIRIDGTPERVSALRVIQLPGLRRFADERLDVMNGELRRRQARRRT